MACSCGIDWDDAFAVAPYIPGSETYAAFWAQRSAAFRDGWADKALDMRYGTASRATLDLFHPVTPSRGLIMFVHGGFWKAFGKADWSYLAQGALERGYAVAMPGYTLTPVATLPEITREIAAALTFAAKHVDGPIHLVGHSAGGHLATRMLCADVPLPAALRARLVRVVSVSGLHDLLPLLGTAINEILNLTEDSARSESLTLCPAPETVPVIAWVGAEERPEFLRQSSLLAERWRQKAELHVEPGRHHFDVIEGLTDPASPLMNALLSAAPTLPMG